jgi:hypothetical protein
MGRFLIILGIILVFLGVMLAYTNVFSYLKPGRLPGDITFRRGNLTFYFPIVTSLLLSLLLTVILYLFRK